MWGDVGRWPRQQLAHLRAQLAHRVEEGRVRLDDLAPRLEQRAALQAALQPALQPARLVQLRAEVHLQARAHHAARLRAALRHHHLQRRQPRRPLQLGADAARLVRLGARVRVGVGVRVRARVRVRLG